MKGNMSLAAPISSSYPIFTILFGFLLLGIGIGLERGVAIAIVITGVIMTGISSEHKEESDRATVGKRRNWSAIASAVTSSVVFGAAYLGVDLAVGYFGPILMIWLLRLGAVLFIFPFLILTTRKFTLPIGGSLKWLLLMTLLDSSGFVALTFGYIYSGSSPAVVTTLSSMIGAVTTIEATVVYKDRLTRIQIAGIIILFSGVAILLNV